MICTAKEFVEAWQASNSVPEVAKKIGEPVKSLYGRACYYRKRGVPLKMMSKGSKSRVQWAKLAELARSLSD